MFLERRARVCGLLDTVGDLDLLPTKTKSTPKVKTVSFTQISYSIMFSTAIFVKVICYWYCLLKNNTKPNADE